MNTSCYSTILYVEWYCSSIVKKFTITNPDGAWFCCENAKICQDMAYGSSNVNALTVWYYDLISLRTFFLSRQNFTSNSKKN